MAGRSTGKGKGRQKIKMEKIKNESNLQVTFSKRRVSVFKKAHELSILTGAEVAVIVFSPGGKVYSFGHPTTEAVTGKFLTGISRPLSLTQQLVQAQRDANVVEINAKLTNVKEMIEYEKSRGGSLDKALAEDQNHWGMVDKDEQNLPLLHQSFVALKNVEANLEREINAKAFASVQQNYRAPTGICNYFLGQGGYPPLQVVGATYEGNGTGSSLPAVSRPIACEGSEASGVGGGGSFFPFLMGPDSYGVGASGGVLPGSTSLGFYGNAGGLSLSYEQSLFGGNGGGGSETFIVGPSSFLAGLPNIYGANSSGVGNAGGGWTFSDGPSPFGGGSFMAGPSSFLGHGSSGGLPNTEGASTSGVGNGDGGSNGRVLEWSGSLPPNGFGGRF